MLLCFDCDGVIIDSFHALFDLASRAQAMIGYGRPLIETDFTEIENLTFEAIAERIGIPRAFHATYEESLFSLQNEGWRVRAFENMVDVITALSRKNTIVVITSSHESLIKETLIELKLGGAVAAVMGGDRRHPVQGRRLTKAERITLARSSQFLESETVMIGDAISDIRQGKQAGVKTVGVSWGYQKPDLLTSENPDWLVNKPLELLSLFG